MSLIFVQKEKNKKEIIPVRWMLSKYGALSFKEAEETHSQNNFAGYKMQKQIVCKELKKKEKEIEHL